MPHIVRTGAILMAVLFTLPAASRAESILEAGVREARAVRPGQTQTAPVFWRSTRAPRLLPLLVGAGVGCGAVTGLGYRFLTEYGGPLKGLALGCLGGGLWGAAIGYMVSAR
jgi:hypothetical protein